MTAPATCRVAILARPAFLWDYVAEGLCRAGVVVTGPADTIDALDLADPPHQGAIIDTAVPPRELLLAAATFKARQIPFILIGKARTPIPAALHGHPCLQQPFGSFQVIEQLRHAGLAIAGSDCEDKVAAVVADILSDTAAPPHRPASRLPPAS